MVVASFFAFLDVALDWAWIVLVSSLAKEDLSHSSASLLCFYHYLLYLVWKFVLFLIVFLTLIVCLVAFISCRVRHLCFHPWNFEMTVLHGSSLISLFCSEMVGILAEYCSSRSQPLFGTAQRH